MKNRLTKLYPTKFVLEMKKGYQNCTRQNLYEKLKKKPNEICMRNGKRLTNLYPTKFV